MNEGHVVCSLKLKFHSNEANSVPDSRQARRNQRRATGDWDHVGLKAAGLRGGSRNCRGGIADQMPSDARWLFINPPVFIECPVWCGIRPHWASYGSAGQHCAKEKTIRTVIQNHYASLDEYADGTSCLLAYIRTT